MATSQFRLINSGDAGAPQLYGYSSSLVTVLDYCLITASGWLKPLPNSASVNELPVLGCYKQPSGSGCTLFINDFSPQATALGKEAWATGWETLTTVSAPVGTGSGQFPYFGQISTNGHITICKSATADTITPRPWFMYVDAYTFYLFIREGSGVEKYQSFFFGDIFSYGETDNYKCMIQGRLVDNGPTGTTNDANDIITGLTLTFTAASQGSSGFIQRNYSGRTASPWISKLGDMGKTTTPAAQLAMLGTLPLPGINNTLYITPLLIWEPTIIRGKMRGMYHLPYPITSFSDGQIISGSGEYYGKAFQVVKQGWNAGMWCIEISNTVDTN